MSFNWFRRQHDDSSASTETQVQSETSSDQEVSPESAPETIIDPADLLAYAKAAYKNIQQKQQSQDQESTTVTDEASSVTTSETSEIPQITQEIEEISEESSVIKDEIPVTSRDVGSDTDHTPSEVGIDGQPQLSFLERATADRQAKQERLIATAVEVPEPETTVMPSVSITIAIPELEFDDGFVWSAEVLAAQGRRAEDISIEEITWLKKLRQGLDKTRRNILNQLKAIVGQGPLNQDAVAEIEGILLQADVGVEATDLIIQSLQKKLRDEVTPPEQAIAYLKQILRDMLEKPLESSPRSGFAPEKDKLTIWLITGVNGAGKTTTIGKIAHLAQKSGYNCLIAAADTFRAAAVEQVKVWGSRSGVEVIANPGKNTDPAAIVFDAIAAAQSRKTELLLVDTAGRLQNKKNLMDELSKIRRIIDKKAADARVESLLVLDSTLGQNGLRQAEVFSQAAQLSGVVLTKLDGTAKGGVALAVVQQLGLPIRFIGAGEGIEDLRPFSSYEFVEALLN
ncbi:signal recognition particle-docking protein FtsY [Cylindrospermopsis curvispora]|nr:signal recognition particle-docking protein FtsY [Cylindrospermopsis curvispora]